MASPDDKRSVLSHSHSIDESIKAILQSIQSGGSLAEIEQGVIAVKQHQAGVREYLSSTIEPEYYAERRDEYSTVAMKVFKIPELFESIAQSLPVIDLMGCYSVCRTFRNIVENSMKLQTILFLRADSESKLMICQLPPSGSETKFRAYRDWQDKLIGGINTIGHNGKDQVLSTIGSRWRRMLVAQPPVHRILFSTARCRPDHELCAVGDALEVQLVVRSETGVTIGDICEKAEELFQPHRNCPSGHLSLFYSEHGMEFEVDT